MGDLKMDAPPIRNRKGIDANDDVNQDIVFFRAVQ